MFFDPIKRLGGNFVFRLSLWYALIFAVSTAALFALAYVLVAQEFGWDERKTLEALCWKAGLPADAWGDQDARLQVFTAIDFAE